MLNDNWVFLYVALAACVRLKDLGNSKKKDSDDQSIGSSFSLLLVSNDLMRDHFWRMRQAPKLLQWRDAVLWKYAILYPGRHRLKVKSASESTSNTDEGKLNGAGEASEASTNNLKDM